MNFALDTDWSRSELIGSPRTIDGFFACNNCNVTSLEGAPIIITGDVYLLGNRLSSLEGIHKHIRRIGGILYLEGNPIKSHVLGLLKIEDLLTVNLAYKLHPLLKNSPPLVKVEEIINYHLVMGRNLLACQEELLDNGLDEYAQL